MCKLRTAEKLGREEARREGRCEQNLGLILSERFSCTGVSLTKVSPVRSHSSGDKKRYLGWWANIEKICLSHRSERGDIITVWDTPLTHCNAVIWATTALGVGEGRLNLFSNQFEINKIVFCIFLGYLADQDFYLFYWKGQFLFQSQRKAMQKNAQTTTQLHSSHMLVK